MHPSRISALKRKVYESSDEDDSYPDTNAIRASKKNRLSIDKSSLRFLPRQLRSPEPSSEGNGVDMTGRSPKGRARSEMLASEAGSSPSPPPVISISSSSSSSPSIISVSSSSPALPSAISISSSSPSPSGTPVFLPSPARSASLSSSASHASSASPALSPSPASRTGKWTVDNPNWRRDWRHPIDYPTRRNNLSARIVEEDIERLDDGKFFNDSLINFYLGWLQKNLQDNDPAVAGRIYIFNTYFYPKLIGDDNGFDYNAVKRWTRTIDLLSFDYIIVPVNENNHWYVAIICNAPAIVNPVPNVPVGKAKNPGRRRYNPAQPRIIILDSLERGKSYSQVAPNLRRYLIAEIQERKQINATPARALGMSAVGLPKQANGYDCGVFLLSYLEEFMNQPDEFTRQIMQAEDLDADFQEASDLRDYIRDILFELQEES